MINTKELMLGNLLFLKYYDDEGKEQNTIVEVESIREDCVYFKRTCYRTSASPEELEPIVLCAELLKAFRKYEGYSNDDYSVGETIELTRCANGLFYHTVNFGEYFLETIHFIHQVQNLLNVYRDKDTSDKLKSGVLDWWNKSQK